MDFLPEQTAIMFLQENSYGVLALEGLDPKYPHLSLVYYIYDAEEESLFFLTKKDTHKYQTLQKNPHVSFLVYSQKPPITVRCEGVGREMSLSDTTYHNHFDALIKVIKENHTGSHNDQTPIAKLDAGTVSLMRIDVSLMTYSNFSDADPTIVHNLMN